MTTNYLTDMQTALLEHLENRCEFSRWTADGEKSFTYMGSKWPMVSIRNLIRRGYVVIEAGTGMNNGVDYLAITDDGRRAIGVVVNEPAQADAVRDAKRIVVENAAYGHLMYMAGKPNNVAFRVIYNSDSTTTIKMASINATDIDDMIALLTAAKTELARRANGSVE